MCLSVCVICLCLFLGLRFCFNRFLFCLGAIQLLCFPDAVSLLGFVFCLFLDFGLCAYGLLLSAILLVVLVFLSSVVLCCVFVCLSDVFCIA